MLQHPATQTQERRLLTRKHTATLCNTNTGTQMIKKQTHTLYHGTSWDSAQVIKREGFRPSQGGCLGPGTYVAHADKASRFAANCPRHGGDAGAVVEVRITYTRAKYCKNNNGSWQDEGYDACRADQTTNSSHPEWCLKHSSQVQVVDIRKIECGVQLPAFEGEALSLGAVRHRARQAGLLEIFFNDQSGVVSFAVDATPQSACHHVYYLTGTVLSSFHHPRQGATQVVRRKVDAIKLDIILRGTSSQGTCCCHGAVGTKRAAEGACRHGCSQSLGEKSVAVGDEEAEVKNELEKMQREVKEALAVLEDHRLRREAEEQRAAEQRRSEEKARELAAKRQREAEETAAEAACVAAMQAARRERGTSFRMFLEEVEYCDTSAKETATCVATNGKSSFFIYEHQGGWAYSSGLPDNLHKLVKTRALSHPQPTYVALGMHERYYIKFANGKSQWHGCDEMTEMLHETQCTVRSVAFGQDFDSYFVVFEDGSWQFECIPVGLGELISKRNSRADVQIVSLGRCSLSLFLYV